MAFKRPQKPYRKTCLRLQDNHPNLFPSPFHPSTQEDPQSFGYPFLFFLLNIFLAPASGSKFSGPLVCKISTSIHNRSYSWGHPLSRIGSVLFQGVVQSDAQRAAQSHGYPVHCPLVRDCCLVPRRCTVQRPACSPKPRIPCPPVRDHCPVPMKCRV